MRYQPGILEVGWLIVVLPGRLQAKVQHTLAERDQQHQLALAGSDVWRAMLIGPLPCQHYQRCPHEDTDIQ